MKKTRTSQTMVVFRQQPAHYNLQPESSVCEINQLVLGLFSSIEFLRWKECKGQAI
jgi:hypothetical protein